jgi:anti-sigma factor RsiW
MSEGTERRRHCLELAERLSEYLDDELTPELRREVEAHVRDCATCEEFVASLARTRDLGRWLPRLDLPEEHLRRLTGAARRRLDA